MKRISIFGKEFYIFNKKEHTKMLDEYCKVLADYKCMKQHAEWIDSQLLTGHVVTEQERFSISSIIIGLIHMDQDLPDLKKSIGWS